MPGDPCVYGPEEVQDVLDSHTIVVGSVADDPFAIDVAHFTGQEADISDLIAFKSFANSEFCPRFISDETDFDHIGTQLRGRTVVVVSTCCAEHTRNARAMRTFLVARAAKDNGAARVVLVEPDLFYSAQDRGPRPEHGKVDFERSPEDYKKFDGQPFSSKLYAQLLKTSGVDAVITVHNHSVSVQKFFTEEFAGQFDNLEPGALYADYLARHSVTVPRSDDAGFVVCAPDRGATGFVLQVFDLLQRQSRRMLLGSSPSLLLMEKTREGERRVVIRPHPESPTSLSGLAGRDVVVIDDMVRTGNTIVQCCRTLKAAGARHVIYMVTHFYSSAEVKENLNDPSIDEIVTTNTLPTVLNRDMQGRLRRKMLVLKIEKWIANTLRQKLFGDPRPRFQPPYTIDVSSKNPLWDRVHDVGR
ncbi:MAG: ribose-phosphate pyrophosphokinase [Lentisphaeria bacterium]|nr:ribose-phosphate pyrophosphokinase [Lentisphaeria bacterium]